MLETKKCPKCGKNMIKRYGNVFLTKPPTYLWYWWCRCGHIGPGGIEKLEENTSDKEFYEKLWEEANK